MKDRYLENISQIIVEVESFINLDGECDGVTVSELPIEDVIELILEEIKHSSEKEKVELRVNVLKTLDGMPSLTARLSYLEIKKLDMSIIPFTNELLNLLVELSKKSSIGKETVTKSILIKLALQESENLDMKNITRIEYKIVRLVCLLILIGAYIGAYYLADLVLKQILYNEDVEE